MIKTMTIGPYVLNGSKISFMRRDPLGHTFYIYIDNYEFSLTPHGISLYDGEGRLVTLINGLFYIFITDENGKEHSFDSDEDFAESIVDLFRAV